MDMEDSTAKKWVYFNAVLSTVLTVIVIYLCRECIRWRRWVNRINLLPGPKGIPILGNALQTLLSDSDMFKNLTVIVRENGPIFRFWFGPVVTVNISSAEYAEAVLGSTKYNEKSFLYTFLHPWVGQGILTSSGEKWHFHRKLLTPTFHFKSLEVFNDIFNAKSRILIDKLETHCSAGKSFNVYPYITRAALDIICESAMGINIKAQDEKHLKYVESIYKASELISIRSRRPWLFPDVIYYLTSKGKEFTGCLKILHDFTNNVIDERREYRRANSLKFTEKSREDETLGRKSPAVFLDILLDAQDCGANISDTSVREEVDTFMIAGHDTSGSSVCWTLYLLGLYKDKQEMVFREIDKIFEGKDRHMTTSDSAEMKYLERVIKESLRLYPPGAVIGRNLSEDVQMGDYVVPAGVGVLIQIHELHRDPRYFPDPEVFDPDRFLPERSKGRHPYAYIPFSAGPRNCLGQKFAMMEQKAIISNIIRKYKVTSVDKREDLVLTCDIVLRPANGVNIILERRP